MRNYDLTDIRLLMIESNETMQRLLKNMIRSLGISQFQVYESGREALDQIEEFAPDLILLDWVSSDLNGLDIVRALRAESSPNRYISIIMMSGLSSLKSIEQARDAGINEFLAKPLSPLSLYEKICHVIERPRPFIRANDYFGPDRRRKQLPLHHREDRRRKLDDDE